MNQEQLPIPEKPIGDNIISRLRKMKLGCGPVSARARIGLEKPVNILKSGATAAGRCRCNGDSTACPVTQNC
jgi:hypothetical protein